MPGLSVPKVRGNSLHRLVYRLQGIIHKKPADTSASAKNHRKFLMGYP